MSDDIVYRLRHDPIGNDGGPVVAEMMDEAADEIERLRAEVETGVEDSAGWRELCIEQDAEIDRLRAVLQSIAHEFPHSIGVHDDPKVIARRALEDEPNDR